MFETPPEKPARSGIQVLLGFLLGIVASLGCLFLAIFLGFMTRGHEWVFPLFNAIALILVGIIALKNARESSYALGAVIALSIALLLDGACAVAFLRR